MTARLIEPEKKEHTPEDYDFIKHRLRYPLDSFRRIFPFIFFSLVIVLIFLLIYLGKPLQLQRSLFAFIFIHGFSVTAMALGIYRYWRSLYFIRVAAAIDESTNIALLQGFLHAGRFHVHQPGGHPEVFMISSREDAQYRESEIVVFMAVDKAILVNSHISTASLFPHRSRQYRELLESLRAYLQQHNSSDALIRI